MRSGSQIARSMTKRLVGTETGLVGYWRFDEGSGQVASDATGHGLNGRLGDTTSGDASDPSWTLKRPQCSERVTEGRTRVYAMRSGSRRNNNPTQ